MHMHSRPLALRGLAEHNCILHPVHTLGQQTSIPTKLMKCEDYPCCGHTPADPCPQITEDGDRIYKCARPACGNVLLKHSTSSICDECQIEAINIDHNDPTGQDLDRWLGHE